MRIKNGKIALPGADEFFYGDIRIEDGKFVEIGEDLSGNDAFIDAKDKRIFPGCIDPHVHFDDPGYTHREDFLHGSMAAASGGVTTVIDMPCTSIPPVVSLSNLKKKLKIVKPKSIIDFGFYGGVSSLTIDEAVNGELELMKPFILGIKTYFVSGMDTFPRISPSQLASLLAYCKKIGIPVLLHAEDFQVIESHGGVKKSNDDSPSKYYQSRPEAAEVEAVRTAVEIAEKTQARLHIVHVSTGKAASLIGKSKWVSGETAPHYLAFDVADFDRIGPPLKVTPPVKGPQNKSALWASIMNDDLSFIASDHAPAGSDEKFTGSIWSAYSGIPGTGTMFPYLLSEGLLSGRMSLSRFTALTCENAAKMYGIDNTKGAIAEGRDADLVMVDPEENWRVDGESFYSKGKISPFTGMVFCGKVHATMLRGRWVYDSTKGITCDPGYGNFISNHATGILPE